MAERTLIDFGINTGQNSASPATALEPGEVARATNVLLESRCLGRRRPSAEVVSLTSGPAGTIYQLARFMPAVTSSDGQLFAFSMNGSTPEIDYNKDGSGWAAITVSDTVSGFAGTTVLTNGVRPQAANLNGKLFIAYDSDVNRLHVYDPVVSNSVLRRVGIAASAAATVANTGSGSYPATIRYYKIQWRLYAGTDRRATSELSAVVSFTPSGSGTDARITKPTTSDSATHWCVFGSADGVNFYGPVTNATFTDGLIPVATTTFDDSTTVSSYVTAFTIAPSTGLYVPPPSARFLLSDGSRLLMAGSYETTASSAQTSPRNSRVWFTQRNGALDETGEDEAIAHGAYNDWIDVGENDGDGIVGLIGPLYGAIYVFKERTIWALTPTGIADAPYRADRVSDATGAVWQDGIAMGEDATGRPVIYFSSLTGPKRITYDGAVEDIGADLRLPTASNYSSVASASVACWDVVRRVMWWIGYGASTHYGFQPEFERRTPEGVRGGWTTHTITIGTAANTAYAAVLHILNSVLVPYIAGAWAFDSSAQMATLSGITRRDASSVAIDAVVVSAVFQMPQQVFSAKHPVIEWQYPGAATQIAVQVASVLGGPLATIGTSSDTTSNSTYSETVIQEKLEGIQIGDMHGMQVTVTWDTAVDGTQRPRIHRVSVPIAAGGPV